MEAAGIPVAGTLAELVHGADVVVDCTPKGVAAKYRDLYAADGVKVVWQGGEKHETAGCSFVAQVNYAGALGRVLGALDQAGLVKRARAVLLRRATDPWESHQNGTINTVVPETRVPSH
jgi:glyceraldehyde-3-phosphate dehydrogenase (NAD(P))